VLDLSAGASRPVAVGEVIALPVGGGDRAASLTDQVDQTLRTFLTGMFRTLGYPRFESLERADRITGSQYTLDKEALKTLAAVQARLDQRAERANLTVTEARLVAGNDADPPTPIVQRLLARIDVSTGSGETVEQAVVAFERSASGAVAAQSAESEARNEALHEVLAAIFGKSQVSESPDGTGAVVRAERSDAGKEAAAEARARDEKRAQALEKARRAIQETADRLAEQRENAERANAREAEPRVDVRV